MCEQQPEQMRHDVTPDNSTVTLFLFVGTICRDHFVNSVPLISVYKANQRLTCSLSEIFQNEVPHWLLFSYAVKWNCVCLFLLVW